VHRQLVPYAGKILGDYRCIFKKELSATDNLFVLRCILENVVNLLVIYFNQAYDSINRTY
jgi:hypothetical protein